MYNTDNIDTYLRAANANTDISTTDTDITFNKATTDNTRRSCLIRLTIIVTPLVYDTTVRR